MKVALDVRFRVESGASTYIRSLLPPLFEGARGAEFTYVRYEGQSLEGLPKAATIDAPLGSASRDLAWTNRALPAALRSTGMDLYHGLKLFGPLRAKTPMVHSVHSITKPGDGEFPMSLTQRAIHAYGNAVFRRSRRVIGVSPYVSRFLVDEVGIAPERVRTVRLGVSDTFRKAIDRADPELFQVSGLGDAPYLVCVGNVEYVKNHATAVRALGRIRDRIPHHLVIAGRADKPAAAELRALIESEGLGGRVHLVGFLDLPVLASCLVRARLQVHPSLSEGFCLAVLEGMCAGVPIIGSAIPGVLEVVGDDAFAVEDPLDDRAFADAIVAWLDEPGAARQAAERARAASRALTWERTAELTLAVYAEALGTP